MPRVLEHRRREHPDSFTAQYRTFRLVYYEEFVDVRNAIAREKQIKRWARANKFSPAVGKTQTQQQPQGPPSALGGLRTTRL